MEPIPLEVDYDEDELSVSDPQAETTQAALCDFPPSKVLQCSPTRSSFSSALLDPSPDVLRITAGVKAHNSNPVPPPTVESPPEREPGEVLEEGETPDDDDVEVIGSSPADASPKKARGEKSGDSLDTRTTVAIDAPENAWLRGVRAARKQLKQSRQRRELQSSSGSNIGNTPAVGEGDEETSAPVATDAPPDEFGGDDGIVEDGDYLYDVYYSEAAGIKTGAAPAGPQAPLPQRPLLPLPPGRAPFLPPMHPFPQPGYLLPPGAFRPPPGLQFVRPGYLLPPPPGAFTYRPPPQPYPPPGGPPIPVTSERPALPVDRPQAPMGPPGGFPPAAPPLRLPPPPGSYPPASYGRPYENYEGYAPPPPGAYYPEDYGAPPHDAYAGHHMPVPYPPAHAVHHYPPAYEAEELDEYGRVRRRAPPPLPPRPAAGTSPTRRRAERSRSNSAARRRPVRAANKRARLSGSRSPRSSSSSSRSRSSSASGRAMRRLQAVKSKAPPQQSIPASSSTSLPERRGANGRRGGPTEGLSRSRATGDMTKGTSNGRAAGRRSFENRSSSSRSSSSASSSSAADSGSPRKRRRPRDRRFDRYEDSDAERAARRTRRPRPLASVKDILAKTGDQPAFRSNKTPVKLTLSKNRPPAGSASQSMPGSSARETPTGTSGSRAGGEGLPRPSASGMGEVRSEERARQKMDKRAKLLEQLQQVESAIAKIAGIDVESGTSKILAQNGVNGKRFANGNAQLITDQQRRRVRQEQENKEV